jgi:hypothetical protein
MPDLAARESMPSMCVTSAPMSQLFCPAAAQPKLSN